MKILLIESEPREARALTKHLRALQDHAEVLVVGEVRKAFLVYQTEQPELVLVNVAVSGRKGADLCRRISQWSRRTAVVLYGASPADACLALEHGAVDYLVRPFEVERLRTALVRARIMVSGMGHASRVAENAMMGVESFLTCRLHGQLKLIPVQEIHSLRAEDKYVTATHRHGEDLIDESLSRLEARYGEDHFIRVHRNGLVARRQIRALRCDGQHQHHVVLHDGGKFKVSRRHVGEIRSFLLSRANANGG